MSDIPPNEKAWTEEQRETVQGLLPGHMFLCETSDMRVGMWVHIGVGGSVKISQIEDERDAIIEAFEAVGVTVRVPLVGRISRQGKRSDTFGYLCEIENWEAV